ncbi:hypothetical protein [Schlesneria sp. DSM 10557]
MAVVRKFGRLFYNVGGRLQTIDVTHSRMGQHRHDVRSETREVFA